MRVLIFRLGAFGDNIIITPVLRRLKQLGHYVIVVTSEQGVAVFAHNTNVDEIKYHERDSIEIDKIYAYAEWLQKEYKADKIINFTETIERRLAYLQVDEKLYNLPKEERISNCNKNYYEYSMEWAGLECESYRPDLFFTKGEEKETRNILNFKKFNVLCGLIGSGMNKFNPWMPYIINRLYEVIPNLNVITVGDKRCEHIQSIITDKAQKLSGKVSMRTSMCLAKYSDLVIAPDTGLLHASGCFRTPKIGLLGHTTVENITKHFINNYSIEAECECAPCMRIIYDYKEQCPVDEKTGAAMCMGAGIDPMKVIDRVMEVYNKSNKRR